MSKLLPENFNGTPYRLADNWYKFLDVNQFNNIPINYIEIGAFYGANLFSVANSYCVHKDSKLIAIDPWQDYNEYPEYKNRQNEIYETFKKNLNSFEHKNKIQIMRGFSNQELLKLPDNNFDIIYIDGNHEPEYVLEDAVLCFRKLKNNGFLIFDDYGWGGPDLTKRGIDAFTNGYFKRIKILGILESQVFCKKIK